MSGPALLQHDSHQAIHEAAYEEAKALTEWLQSLDSEQFLQHKKVIDLLLEHWNTRVLAHAKEEEEGLYLTWEATSFLDSSTLQQFVQEHQQMRDTIQSIVAMQEEGTTLQPILMQFLALLAMSQQHSSHEERELRKGGKSNG